jgi:hypothetical protein
MSQRESGRDPAEFYERQQPSRTNLGIVPFFFALFVLITDVWRIVGIKTLRYCETRC